ncbi:MAG: transposase [Verrucomicrobiae bacterium]|nr:transposase [Verrucomicrobiae bacterium]
MMRSVVMRNLRILGAGPVAYYHVISRVIERRFIFDVQERERFRKLMRQQEAFSGVRVLSWTCLSNHFHMLVAIDDKQAEAQQAELDRLRDDDVYFLERLRHVYKAKAVGEIADALEQIRMSMISKDEQMVQIGRLKQPYLERMYNLSAFVGELKQRLSQWYNKVNDRKGTLWEERFKSVLVQGEPGLLALVAAYIDLNAVRAGIVTEPRRWRWCGYAEAVAAQSRSRDGLFEVLGEGAEGNRDGAAWKVVHQRYRRLLLNSGQQRFDDEGEVSAKGFTREQLELEESRDFVLPSVELLGHRIRYFADGLALGSAAFIEETFDQNRGKMRVKRSRASRSPKVALGALHTLIDLRSLRREPLGRS